MQCLFIFVACILYIFVFDDLQFHDEYLGVTFFLFILLFGALSISKSVCLIHSGKFSVMCSNIASAPLSLHFFSGTRVKHMSDLLLSSLFHNICFLFCICFSFLCFTLDSGLANPYESNLSHFLLL